LIKEHNFRDLNSSDHNQPEPTTRFQLGNVINFWPPRFYSLNHLWSEIDVAKVEAFWGFGRRSKKLTECSKVIFFTLDLLWEFCVQ